MPTPPRAPLYRAKISSAFPSNSNGRSTLSTQTNANSQILRARYKTPSSSGSKIGNSSVTVAKISRRSVWNSQKTMFGRTLMLSPSFAFRMMRRVYITIKAPTSANHDNRLSHANACVWHSSHSNQRRIRRISFAIMALGTPCRILHNSSTTLPLMELLSPLRLQKSRAAQLSSLALHNVRIDSPVPLLSPRKSNPSLTRQASALVTAPLLPTTP